MKAIELIQLIINLCSVICAMLAALKWFEASRSKIPPHTHDSWDGNAPFSEALKRQASQNAIAAAWAAGAALLQCAALSIQAVGHLWGKIIS